MIRASISTSILFALALLLAGPHTVHAAESYDSCAGFITSIPTVISTPGTWCLRQDLTSAMSNGIAIDIQSDNVAIDCNDFRIDNSAAGVGTNSFGIHADTRSNITVRHCNIRGFAEGISLQGYTGGHVIEDNRLEGNTYIGIYIFAEGAIMRRNQVLNTGGSTQIASAYGINTISAVDILDNTVSGVTARSGGNGEAAGIYGFLLDSTSNKYDSGNSTNGNRVRGVHKDGTGRAYGIYYYDFIPATHVVLRNNVLVGDGDAGSIGLDCPGLTTTNGRAKGNVINGFATSIGGCGDAGGNDLTH